MQGSNGQASLSCIQVTALWKHADVERRCPICGVPNGQGGRIGTFLGDRATPESEVILGLHTAIFWAEKFIFWAGSNGCLTRDSCSGIMRAYRQ